MSVAYVLVFWCFGLCSRNNAACFYSVLYPLLFISEHPLCVNIMSEDSGGLSTRALVIMAYLTT